MAEHPLERADVVAVNGQDVFADPAQPLAAQDRPRAFVKKHVPFQKEADALNAIHLKLLSKPSKVADEEDRP